jgi:peptidyl-prolyl cis-trans isomerase B (cyclophilin B)
MNNNLKTLFGVIAATVLLVGCSVPEKETTIQKEPEITKETPTMILIKTTKGDIKLELDAAKAPKTVANFLKYVESGHYSNTIFHRVISTFMIQGGGMTADMNQKKAPYTVENEANNGLKNVRGSIAMARTSDPHSAGAQFFINVVDNGFLDFKAPTQQGWGYCVFGKVVEGMDVVDAIRAVPTASGDVPKETITITEVSVIK